MGYTHYWSFQFPLAHLMAEAEAAYIKACVDCGHIATAYYAEHGGLAGYTAHATPGKYGGVLLNGSREDAHEPFTLREKFTDNEANGFCKTARKPYDTVVTACLLVLADALPGVFSIASDGLFEDWVPGLRLAEQMLGRKLHGGVPMSIKTTRQSMQDLQLSWQPASPLPANVVNLQTYRLKKAAAKLSPKTISFDSVIAKQREAKEREQYNKQLSIRLGLKRITNKPGNGPNGSGPSGNGPA